MGHPAKFADENSNLDCAVCVDEAFDSLLSLAKDIHSG